MLLSFTSFVKRNRLILCSLSITLLFLSAVWLRGGLDSIFLDTDLGRDLSELSNIQRHHVVWLGPRLSVGFPSSPIYYYLFFPAILISHWNANALIIANILLALFALGVYGVLGKKKWGMFTLVAILVTGLAPFWRSSAIHPGNGFTYIFWLFLSLTTLWFELPLFLSALLMGLAIAHHPAAIFGVLLLLYEWWIYKHSLKTFGLMLIGLILPWFPIIAFEVITKGFLVRSFLDSFSHNGTLALHVSFINLHQIATLVGLGNILSVLMLVIVGYASKGRVRMWLYSVVPSLIFFMVSPAFPLHYLLGISCILTFIAIQALSDVPWGRVILVGLLICFIFQSLILSKAPTSTRSISKINNVVDTFIKSEKVQTNNKIAVVAILGRDTSVPQADDYRYFLRVKGYNVLDVVEYAQADTLLMFVEEPRFAWQTWSSWETDQFGSRKITYKTVIDGVTIVEFKK
ncbi:MAG: hypothetical protein RI947_193 [Candidatus Parcubacteria bacterium]|jgi:hypothetical protein